MDEKDYAPVGNDPAKAQLLRLSSASLENFRRVDAGFKIDAGLETITSSLIDAQAGFDELVAYKSPIDISKLREELETALGGFRKARMAAGQDRSESLMQARSALASASATLQALKSDSSRTTP